MSALADECRAAAFPISDARGGFGNRLRKMQDLLRRAADELDTASAEDVRAALNAACAGRQQKAFADRHGLLQSTVSEVASGKKDVPESIANALGFYRCHIFRKITKVKPHE